MRHAVAPQTLVDACRSSPDKMARRALYLKTAQVDRRANRVVQSFLVHNGINIFGELVCLPRGSQQVATEQGGQWVSRRGRTDAKLAARLRHLTQGRKHTPAEKLMHEGRDER